MNPNLRKIILSHPILSSVIIFAICLIIRLIEYFVIKTDTTFFSENFLHKLFGVLILALLLKIMRYKWRDIGFRKQHFAQYLIFGLLLGLLCFSVAYAIEYLVLSYNSQDPNMTLFVNGFSLTGNATRHTETYFFLLCIILNIINVIMEEGLFRGFFLKVINMKTSFLKSNLIVALLFGLWHFVMPLQLFISGEINLLSCIIMTLGYIILAGIMSLKWGMLYRMTGSLFISIGDHLFNNIIATNLLHIVTNTGADQLQIIRILIAQTISFIIVLIIYKNWQKKKQAIFTLIN